MAKRQINYGWGKTPTYPGSRPRSTGGSTGDNFFDTGGNGAMAPKPKFSPGTNKEWVYYPNENTWYPEDINFGPQGGGGGGSDHYGADLSYALGLKGIEFDYANLANEKARTAIEKTGVMESIRSNKATEAENKRQRALQSAMHAVDSYLTGAQLADARRLNAFQEARALLPSLVDPNQTHFAGQEPGGTLATVASRFGLPFQGTKIQHKQMDPKILATEPGPMAVGSQVMGYINEVKKAGR